ncbi:MAG: bifunctional aldolase/short-chain dehydrogenase [Alphaproteobacteria bacterium]|nr:bifunctional aldolase/short-chain dehydrogenase [Alphaproteobacteria bacterium]
MQSTWNDGEAARAVAAYGEAGVNEDLALRVYTTRLLGREGALVLHGGGNTSVKTQAHEIDGTPVDAICVKGSGWDMGDIEPPGLPALRLKPLLRLQALDALCDEAMVNAQRSQLLLATAPNPSVETLLHAFVPAKYIDHTHANAILAVSDQPNGMAICRDLFEPDLPVLDYVMPGFALAKAVAAAIARSPGAHGLILHKHGIFTFGTDAREAYERMIAMVSRAEAHLARGPRKSYAPASLPKALAAPADVLPILRGALAESRGEGRYARFVCELRREEPILAFCERADLAAAAWEGVITPDHTIRIKNKPLVLPAPASGDLPAFRAALEASLETYKEDYHAYFARQDSSLPGKRKELDPLPRLALVPGIGLVAFGRSKKDARIAADLGAATVATVGMAERIGAFEPLPERDLFMMEYWSLEQAKLGKAKESPLAGQVALVTGGGGAIGAATAKAFAESGAELVVLDLDGAAAKAAAAACGRSALGLACDVTDAEAVRAAFDRACTEFGGVDIVVSNAGNAIEGAMAELSDEKLRKSFELNFFAHQTVARNAVRVMKAQGTGGCLLFNVSKQAVNPGPDFGAYGTSKAAALLLCRQYALECGAYGIRANAVNADRIRSGLLDEARIASRAKARGLSVADYMGGNLLKQEVTARDVAEAFLYQALMMKTTGNVVTVDGGNVAAMLR